MAKSTCFGSALYFSSRNPTCANLSDKCISRVLLLTDGLANVGVPDPIQLSELAPGCQAQGVTTTTIGVGADYNAELLAKMAEMGGGGTYFIDNPEETRSVFTESQVMSKGEMCKYHRMRTRLASSVNVKGLQHPNSRHSFKCCLEIFQFLKRIRNLCY